MSDSNASATSSKSPTSTAPADLTRTPVLVGAGQVTNRDEDPARAPNPFELMKDASIAAANDIGGARRLGDLTHVWMVHSLSVRHGDPSTELAKQLGADKAEARCSGMGGSVPQWLVTERPSSS
ncbi:MAG TPA: hypothetical protein VEJ87_03150 [Acidimicrobiales bacterium]|nr:hypothetical protein [Acidimicrobiales bacterium]